MPHHLELLGRIFLGAALGAVIGLERDRHGRQAGLRTHYLVGLAAATFMVVSAHFFRFQGYAGAAGIATDPSRIAASVVTGIGFLAGGAILKTGLSVQGLTTAAGLWLVAACGLAAGAGMVPEAVLATALGLLALTLFRLLEDKGDDLLRRRVTVQLAEGVGGVPALLEDLARAGARVSDFDFEKVPGGAHVQVTFEARLPAALGSAGLVEILEARPDLAGLRIVSL